jgi:hypothetical protein
MHLPHTALIFKMHPRALCGPLSPAPHCALRRLELAERPPQPCALGGLRLEVPCQGFHLHEGGALIRHHQPRPLIGTLCVKINRVQ